MAVCRPLATFTLLGTIVATPARAATPPQGTPGSILSATEFDGNGKKIPLKDDQALVDIGSDIRIQINREVLQQHIQQLSLGTTTEDLIKGYGLLTAVVQRETALATTQAAVKADPTAVDARKALDTAQKDLSAALYAVLLWVRPISGRPLNSAQAELRTRLNDALEKVRNQDIVAQFEAIHQAVQADLDALGTRLSDALQADGCYFQLGVWAHTQGTTKPIHLDGFDTYSSAPRVDYDRFKIAPSAAEQTKFAEYQAAAKDINTKGISAVALEQVQKAFDNALAPVREAIDGATQALQVYTKAQPGAAATTQALQLAVSDLLAGVNALTDKFTAAASNGSTSEFLQDPSSQLAMLGDKVKKVGDALTALMGSLDTTSAADKTLFDALTTVKNKLAGDLQTMISQAIASAKSLYVTDSDAIATQQFGDKVKKFMLVDLPSEATLSLPDIGERDAGDTVLIQFGIGKASGIVETEGHHLQIQKILVHFETVAGLIFAEQPKPPGSSSLVQAAASYSLLVKFGLRSSWFWNSLMRPGIGINLAVLDFSHSGTPQLGAGVVVTLFRDILQGGYGYNIFADRRYWFFGIGLPLPTFGAMPGASTAASGGATTPAAGP